MFHSGLPDRYEAIKFGNDRVSKIKEKRRGDYGETEEDLPREDVSFDRKIRNCSKVI